MAANDIYINPGAEVAFQSAAGDVLMTVDGGVTAGDGRKSNLWTIAATYATDRPTRYRWTCKAFWQNPALVGETLDIYLAEANFDGEFDGGVGDGDAAFTDEDALRNMTPVGRVMVTHATEEQEYASGVVEITSNKAVLVVWNTSAGGAMHATATNFEFKIMPIPSNLQS